MSTAPARFVPGDTLFVPGLEVPWWFRPSSPTAPARVATTPALPSCGQPFVGGLTPLDGPRPNVDEQRGAWHDTDIPRAQRTLFRAQLWQHWDQHCALAAASAAADAWRASIPRIVVVS